MPSSHKITYFDLDNLAIIPMSGAAGAPATPAAGMGSLYGIGTSNINFGFIDEAGTLIPISTGLRTWVAYTPTVTAPSGTFTSVAGTGRWTQIGKTVICKVDVTVTTAGTATGCVITLPATAQTGTGYIGSGREDAVTGKQMQVKLQTTTTASLALYDNTLTPANGHVYRLILTYEAA